MTRAPWALPLLLVGAAIWALPATGDDFKVPPTPDHHVTDAAGALSSGAHASLENELQAYETATGHQIVVWVGQTTGGVPLETWTAQTAQRWKIGRRGRDDGAVLFVFMQDHKVRIEVGYGLEGSLTDADAHRIIAHDVVPRMKAGDADGAVTSAVAAMLTTITPSYAVTSPPPATSSSTSSSAIGTLLFVISALFFALTVIFVVGRIVAGIRYGVLVMHEGPAAAKKDMRGWWLWGTGVGLGTGGSFSSFGGGGGGGGFSGGGGSFGGGGASGGW